MTKARGPVASPEVRDDASGGPLGEGLLDLSLRLVAILIWVSCVFERAFMPNFRGTFIGLDTLTERLRVGGAMVSQLTASLATFVTLAVVIAVFGRRLPLQAKVLAVIGSGGAILQGALAMGADRPERLVMVVVGGAVVMFAFASARLALPLRPIRAQGAAAMLAAFASFAHLTAAVLAEGRSPKPFESALNAPQILSTLALVCELGIVVAAIAWLRTVRGGIARIVVLAGVTAATFGLALPADDASAARLLVRHGARSLLASPGTLAPQWVEILVAVAAVVGAIVVLSVRGVMVPACVSLGGFLLTRSLADVPMLGLCGALSSGALLLLASEPRVIWASLEPRASTPARRDPTPEDPAGVPAATAAQRPENPGQ